VTSEKNLVLTISLTFCCTVGLGLAFFGLTRVWSLPWFSSLGLGLDSAGLVNIAGPSLIRSTEVRDRRAV